MNPTTLPDRQGLLAAVDAGSPTGIDLRSSDQGLFQQALGIRNNARDSERQHARTIDGDGGHADRSFNTVAARQWQQVAELCCQILVTQSKDLTVCAWLIEAQTRLHGARGLADGLLLYCELVQHYWDGIFPRPDATDGAETCVAALNGLNGQRRPGSVVDAINNFHITSQSSGGDFVLWHYRAAIEAQRITDPEKCRQRIVALGYSLQDIQRAADHTPVEFYQTQHAAIESALMALHRLDALLTQKLGALAPATTMMRDMLGSMHDVIFHLAGTRIAADATQNADPPVQVLPGKPTGSASNDSAPPCNNILLQNRGDAIRCLDAVARYFRHAEPHSPLSYSIGNLVRWAHMPFDQLMYELIPDQSARDVFQLMTGIPLAGNTESQPTPWKEPGAESCRTVFTKS